ncbi:MAG: hypothetical protein WD934_06660 [Gemmatimonadales bacterium]
MAATLGGQSPRLGTIAFPAAGSGEAQTAFVEGVLFLHSFEYGSAATAFRRAQVADPGLAMAYWGEAMTYNHPLWSQWDDVAARAVLQRLGASAAERRARAPTHREQMYLDAVEALWAEGSKPVRDTAYADAMARLVAAHPDDDEARTFYALAILGLSGSTRVVPSYMRAAALAQEVFARQPNHPGAAHVIIHAFDDPTHAPLGLPAARAYSQIAPDAAHAQHMTTHIFVAMGMWDDVVSQNEVAAGLTHWGPGHYTSWLLYGQLQQGRLDVALEQLERARRDMPAGARGGQRGYLAMMRAHYVINSERWDSPVLAWPMDLADVGLMTRAMDVFTFGFAAERRGDMSGARERLTTLRGMVADDGPERVRALALLLEGAIARRAGEIETAVRLMREAAAIEEAVPAEYGPPDVVKPSHELLGEVLLDAGRYAEARGALLAGLRLAPGRRLAERALAAATARQATR